MATPAMHRPDELLPIGRFARACRLSIKALRHYDDLGLLRPMRVDASGYRYYARAQARDAIAISLLRSLDVPLPAIKEILAAKERDAVSSTLGEQKARIEREIARAKQALFCVERIIRDGALMPYEVEVRDEPAQTLVYVEATTTPERHVEVGYELFEKLRSVTSNLAIPIEGPVLCLLPEAPDEDAMVLQMATRARVAFDRSALARAGAASVELGATAFAFVTHRGPYEELGIAQHAVSAWIQERGRIATGPMREIYLNDPEDVPASEILTEVGIPIAR
jgi:DNA-binding transcriptional MerR regulator